MKKRKGFFHIGSFQYPHRFESENPLEEVWSRVARFGAIDYIMNNLNPEKIDIDWDNYVNYAIIRVKQAVEFRESAQNATLLTKPLALYYSFLNLTRGFLALGPEIMPSSAHGLQFIKGDSLFSSSAKLTKGTFTEYLSAFGFNWEKETKISLEEAFARIVEIHQDFISLKQYNSFVFPVRVQTKTGGPVYIDPISPHKEFPENWDRDFPSLKEKCSLEEDDQEFVVDDKDVCENRDSISKFLHENLLNDLIYNSFDSPWYLIRNLDSSISFSRVSYYYIAIFILGSIVGYEPELMLESNRLDSEMGWFLDKFLKKAERFFPQLKIGEQCQTTIYF